MDVVGRIMPASIDGIEIEGRTEATRREVTGDPGLQPCACVSAIAAETLGSESFRLDYGLKYAYLAGAMYKGIASKELVVAMGRASLMGYLGTGGMSFDEMESAIRYIQSELPHRQSYGMNFLCHPERPGIEERTIDLYLKYGISNIEVAAFTQITPSLVRYRLKGLTRNGNGMAKARTRVLAKVSRPEVAVTFMGPAPEAIVRTLVASGHLTTEEAELGQSLPVADDICVEADSGGHTDGGVAYALLPTILALRDKAIAKYRYAKRINVGTAGGIGTPQAAAAAFIMGADFILTGSINQCTVEAGTSEAAKDILEKISVQDTAYAPAGDLFELGSKVQVVKKGLFFPARGNKLYELYQRYNSLDEIDSETRKHIQERYFHRSFDEVWSEITAYYNRVYPEKIKAIEKSPKQRMASIFKWYFMHTSRLALEGRREQAVDYQIHCGPALGAFNEWVEGTKLQSWRNRRVAELAERIMQGTAELLNRQFTNFRQITA